MSVCSATLRNVGATHTLCCIAAAKAGPCCPINADPVFVDAGRHANNSTYHSASQPALECLYRALAHETLRSDASFLATPARMECINSASKCFLEQGMLVEALTAVACFTGLGQEANRLIFQDKPDFEVMIQEAVQVFLCFSGFCLCMSSNAQVLTHQSHVPFWLQP